MKTTSSIILASFIAGSTTTNAFVTPRTGITTSSSSTSRLYASNIQQDIEAKESESQADSQNIFGVVSDAVTGFAFDFLHAFDENPIADSSKNLRVLWVRALLNQVGRIDDPIAQTFLPPTTRSLVTSEGGASLFQPILQFTEWIQARTDFIDEHVDHFLSAATSEEGEGGGIPQECNIVLFGAGYDTRAIRYRHRHDQKINFIEVDLPDVTAGKQTLYETFSKNEDPDWTVGDRHSLVPLDLNECGKDKTKLMDTLREKGNLNPNLPTLFVWEAVLFYVDEIAVRNIFNELTKYGDDNSNTMWCMTDSLQPFVQVPFSNEASQFFKGRNLQLLSHRSRWGGAVHFVGAAVQESDLHQRLQKRMGVKKLVHSYTPTQANNNELLKKPSFDNVWYAVAYPWQIDGGPNATPLEASFGGAKEKNMDKEGNTKPFATRLWGEPLVIYRDAAGDLVAMADVCPHRSVPLSMGHITEEKELVCMYHGWKFGKEGDCVDIPTLHKAGGDMNNPKNHDKTLNSVTKANCGNMRAVVEHEGLVYIWRGDILKADPGLLPTRRKGDMETVPIDTVLDYAVDYSYIVENNLDSPHLFYLHDGSVPPIESIGMKQVNLPKLTLKAFTDDCGMGHLGKLGGSDGKPKKLLRFDPPNIVRHGGVSGFEEEFHICPIAPQRTRVLLRQHLPRGPILTTLTNVPGVIPLLTFLVNNWNYHIALEDSNVMQGQANRIEDWGMPRMTVGGLGDDLIKRYWNWRSQAHLNFAKDRNDDTASPYSPEFLMELKEKGGIPTGTSYGDSPQMRQHVQQQLNNAQMVSDDGQVDRNGQPIGSWGIKQDYLQETPAANFPPMNFKQYARALVLDTWIKDIVMSDDEEIPEFLKYSSQRTTTTTSTIPQNEEVSAAAAATPASTTTTTGIETNLPSEDELHELATVIQDTTPVTDDAAVPSLGRNETATLV